MALHNTEKEIAKRLALWRSRHLRLHHDTEATNVFSLAPANWGVAQVFVGFLVSIQDRPNRIPEKWTYVANLPGSQVSRFSQVLNLSNLWKLRCRSTRWWVFPQNILATCGSEFSG
jgi:hypothetical protein